MSVMIHPEEKIINERITTFLQVLHTSRKYTFTVANYLFLYAYNLL
jgi:hypothetical protein